jgi:hypothetical protein
MHLESGQQIRHYRIVESIGAGGMGEVYRARDTNLERDVALKVLPRAVAGDAQNLARLEREAKAIAALSHPNILAVYDFGKENGTAFVVTELLEGETLRERLTHGSIAPRKAAELGRQIARGLAAAHDKSIVHRDLKPENVILTNEGRAKILDFGLATVDDDSRAVGGGDDHQDATHTVLTAPGTVLGTVGYMSPEQVRGEETDHRSDIFSFGSVLYEMVGGERPFRRETHAETMTAILKEEPTELTSLSGDVPPALSTIIRRCMEKRPGERFHSAHDLAFSLEAFSDSAVSTGATAAIAAEPERRRRPGLAVAVGSLLIGIVIGVAAILLLRPPPEPAEPPSFAIASARRGTVAKARFSSGGESAIFSAAWEGGPLRLYTATRGSRISAPLDFQDAELLSVSSTGELALSLGTRFPIGWETIGTLAVAQPGRSAPRQILEDVFVADWAPDGQSLAVAHEEAGVVRLEYPIGTVLYESPGWISDLRVHPDGDRVLIADCPIRGDNVAAVKIIDRQGAVEVVAPVGGSWGLLWAPDGETVLFSNGTRVFSVRPGEDPRRILQLPSNVRLQDLDASGRMLASVGLIRRDMIVRAPGSAADADLSWLTWSTPRILSDDGRIVLFEEGNDRTADGYAIYMRDTDGSPPLRLGYGTVLALSPDNDRIAVLKRQFADDSELLLVPTGPGEPASLEVGDLKVLPGTGAWLARTADGDPEALVFAGRDGDGIEQLYHLSLTDGAVPRAITPPDLVLASQGHVASADGPRLIVNPANGPAVEFDIDGNGPFPLSGVEPGDLPLGLDRDGKHLYVQASFAVPSPIVRVNLETGKRALWRELSPLDPSGVFVVDRVKISADGAAHVYSNRRVISWLTIIDGLQ